MYLKRSSKTTFEIPYHLDTIEDIRKAQKENLLLLGSEAFRDMLSLAEKASLHMPPALIGARKIVERDFITVREEKIRESKTQYFEIANLDLINNFPSIKDSIPKIDEILRHETIFSLVRDAFPDLWKRCAKGDPRTHPSTGLESILALRGAIRKELLTYLAAKKSKMLGIDALKTLLVAITLHESGNDDILEALRSSCNVQDKEVLYQNAIAELLFTRLPNSVEQLFRINPGLIRKKLFAKIARLPMTSRQRTNLYGCFKLDTGKEDLVPVLEKMNRIAQRLSMEKEVKVTLNDYFNAMIEKIRKGQTVYPDLFLTRELATVKRLYTPRKIMECKTTYRDFIMKSYTHTTKIQFYLVKDYLDLFKGVISHDCIKSKLGEEHLLTPNYFTIRFFRDGEWCGNIYALDFTKECNVILIDRIQIPRGIKATYLYFFEDLRSVLEELFADVDYEYILLPLAISNHDRIQTLFNHYNGKLSRMKFSLNDIPQAEHFESLRKGKTFYVLSRKEQKDVRQTSLL